MNKPISPVVSPPYDIGAIFVSPPSSTGCAPPWLFPLVTRPSEEWTMSSPL